jgi:peptidoglycan/LPS O-acetylase OafA/YrhL
MVGHMGGLFGMNLVDPPAAVELFFIISGFYMALILSEKYNSYFLFISNRFLKIYPAYLFILLVTLSLSGIYFIITHNYENGIIGKIAAANGKLPFSTWVLAILPNFTIFGQDLLFFLKTDSSFHLHFTTNFSESPLILIRFLAVPQAWSISLELMFYLVAPFFNKLKTPVLLTIGLLSLGIKLMLHYKGLTHDPWTYRFFPSELLFFILGMLAYRFYKTPFFSRLNGGYAVGRSNLPYIALVIILIFYSVLVRNTVLLNLLFVLFTFLLPFVFEKFKRNKLDKKIGDFSYELYIAHELCIYALLTILNKISSHTEINKVAVIVAALVFSYTVSVLVTQKIDKFRQRRALAPDLNSGAIQPVVTSTGAQSF